MKFIKATSSLPEVNKSVCIKISGNPKGAMLKKHGNANAFVINGGGVIDNDQFHLIEWLDESDTSLPVIVDRNAIIREVANYICPYDPKAADLALECLSA